MVSIVNSRDVTREFENSMLEAPAHAEEGKSRVTSMTNGGEGALGARIGTRRREPDRVDQCQVRTRIGSEPGCRDPAPLQGMLAQLAHVTESFIDREMGDAVGVIGSVGYFGAAIGSAVAGVK